jgi:hypothetical protein
MTTKTGLMTEIMKTPPDPWDVGRTGTWELQVSDGEPVLIKGTFLGMSSSRRPTHENHDGHPYGVDGCWTTPNQRCSACRWFEPRIFVSDEEPHFFGIYKIGRTIVPGETDRLSYVKAGSAFELIESMAIRRGGKLVLPIPSRRVIAQAAGYDQEIRIAYLDWRKSAI